MDQTQHKRLERERAAAQANELALRETARRMDEFLGIAAHEMRTPLTAIKSTVQLLARREQRAGRNPDSGEESVAVLDSQGQLIARVAQQVRRLVRLVDDLVDVSRIREGKLELRLAACDLVAVVCEMSHEQQQLHADRTVSVQVPPATQAVSVVADADRIGQVVTNYLTNALKYAPADRPITVRLEVTSGTMARVSVQDEGPGIPANEQAHVWELFYQGPSREGDRDSRVGVGLGLHISRTIVERHGGQVGVASEAGQGSTFWFTLPLAGAGTAGDNADPSTP